MLGVPGHRARSLVCFPAGAAGGPRQQERERGRRRSLLQILAQFVPSRRLPGFLTALVLWRAGLLRGGGRRPAAQGSLFLCGWILFRHGPILFRLPVP